MVSHSKSKAETACDMILFAPKKINKLSQAQHSKGSPSTKADKVAKVPILATLQSLDCRAIFRDLPMSVGY